MKIRLLTLIFLGLTWNLQAQTVVIPYSPPPALIPLSDPKDYTKEEFQPWMLELRRAEIIAIGAFPFMFMFTGLGYDYYYYFQSGMNANYVPWPAGPGTSQWTTSNNSQQLQDKYKTLVISSLGLSLALAVMDWALGKAGVP